MFDRLCLRIPIRQRNAAQTRVSERSIRSGGMISDTPLYSNGRETRLRGVTVKVQLLPGAWLRRLRTPTR